MFAVSWLGVVGIETATPGSNRDQVAPAPERPWDPPVLPTYENALGKSSPGTLGKGKELVDVRKEYTLAGIHTVFYTPLIIALDSTGATIHKGFLRIVSERSLICCASDGPRMVLTTGARKGSNWSLK